MKFKIIFKKPSHTDIVLIYPNAEKLLKKYVFGNFSYQTIDIATWVCVNPLIIWKTCKLFSKIRLDFSLKVNYFVVDLIKRIYEIHLQAYIEEINPRFVITYIDDSRIFHRLNANYRKDSLFLLIQNGLRPKSHFRYLTRKPDSISYKMSHFFCFGSADVTSFKHEDYKVDNYYPVGSLVGGIYWKEISKKTSIEYDICYVSCWVSENKSNLNDNTMKVWRADRHGNKILENNLKKLINEKGYSVIIALKYENSKEEFEHFYDCFGDTVKYQHSIREEFSTYRAIDKARLAISLYSTCGAETIGIGRKALFCNGSGNASIGIPSAGICYYEGEDYDEFKNKVENILNMSDENFKEGISKIRKEIMNYNLNEMPHESISRFLQENK